MTLNFASFGGGARWSDREWVNGTKMKPSDTVNILEAARVSAVRAECRASVIITAVWRARPTKLYEALTKKEEKERNNLIMEVKLCIKVAA